MKNKHITFIGASLLVACLGFILVMVLSPGSDNADPNADAYTRAAQTLSLPNSTPEPPTATLSVDSPQYYVDSYGGDIDTYIKILSMTDCKALKALFDTVNRDYIRGTPGTDENKWALGYMTASDNRMRALGCYY